MSLSVARVLCILGNVMPAMRRQAGFPESLAATQILRYVFGEDDDSWAAAAGVKLELLTTSRAKTASVVLYRCAFAFWFLGRCQRSSQFRRQSEDDLQKNKLLYLSTCLHMCDSGHLVGHR